MSYSSAKRRRIKPFARPTSMDINVAFDIRHYQHVKYGKLTDPAYPAAASDESFKVMEGEILMQTSAPGVRRYGDHQCHVFSFANGLKGRTGNTKKALLTDLKYAGVAVTEFTPEKDVFEQGFVMTLGGLNTLFNSGSSILYPGDLICADIPNGNDIKGVRQRALQTGVPHGKLQFVITPYEDLKKQVKDDALASRFIMGTALSYSAPGSPVDVVLHKCNVICRKEISAAATPSSSGASSSSNSSGASSSSKSSASQRIKKRGGN